MFAAKNTDFSELYLISTLKPWLCFEKLRNSLRRDEKLFESRVSLEKSHLLEAPFKKSPSRSLLWEVILLNSWEQVISSCSLQLCESKDEVEKKSHFFLICRRARRQRSQSPILVTVRIDKHFKLYIDWSLSGKSKSSQLASQVMESTSTFLLIATVQSFFWSAGARDVRDRSRRS